MNTGVCITPLLAQTGGVCCTVHSQREFALSSSPLRSQLADFANPAVQGEMYGHQKEPRQQSMLNRLSVNHDERC